MTAAQTPACGSEQEQPRWRVSIISHGHGRSVAGVALGLQQANPGVAIRFVVTINIPEDLSWIRELPRELQQRLQIKHNHRPQSFALNHNQALAEGDEPFLITADPELVKPFPSLDFLEFALQDGHAGLVAPQALDELGQLEDNGRSLPRPMAMVWRNLMRHRPQRVGATYARAGSQRVAWLAGYFLASRRSVWQELGGFDTRYRMYCEDVDLGLRCGLAGYTVQVLGQSRVGHPARRATFKQLRHLRWHLHSLLRLWFSSTYSAYRQLEHRTQDR